MLDLCVKLTSKESWRCVGLTAVGLGGGIDPCVFGGSRPFCGASVSGVALSIPIACKSSFQPYKVSQLLGR